MTCDKIKVPGGMAIVCQRGQRVKRCRECASKATKLCDYKGPGKKRTCSAPMCDAHAVPHPTNPDTDYCNTHALLIAQLAGKAEIR